MKPADLDFLTASLGALAIKIDPAQLGQLVRFHELLLEANQTHNLISPGDLPIIVPRHIVDSLLLAGLALFKEFKGRSILDVGSGAGFPGIPLAVCFPDTRFTLLDAQRKRVAFLKKVCRELAMTNVQLVCERLESAQIQSQYPAQFGGIVTRAVENFESILKNSLPLLQHGGILTFYKGKDLASDLATIELIMRMTPITYTILTPANLPNYPYQRHFLVVHVNT